ncbi:chromatin modification- protein eaf6 [Conglomerata obtusa]
MKKFTEDTAAKEKLLDELINKKRENEKHIKAIEKEIFKYETIFLETAQGFPLTKTLDYYLNNRTAQKKNAIKDSDRIFSKNLPKINEK